MKALVKYPLSLFILLLIGYSQLFAPLYRGTLANTPTKKIARSVQGEAIDVKTPDPQTIFIAEEEEEEDDRISLRKYFQGFSSYSYSLIPEYFFPLTQSHFSLKSDFSCFSFSRSPYLVFQVFRL